VTETTYKLMVNLGKYTDRDGKEKNRWKEIGRVLEGDKGPFALMDPTFNLAAIQRDPGRDMVLVSMFKPDDDASPARVRKEARKAQEPQRTHAPDENPFDESIPF
jgi:hypothetical protein